MTHKRMIVDLLDIVPQQHYLNRGKYRHIQEQLKDLDAYGDIYVIEYRGRLFSVDGHHRLFYLYERGVQQVQVVCERADNDNKLYQILADEALELGINDISDLRDRFTETWEAFQDKWINKCEALQKRLRQIDAPSKPNLLERTRSCLFWCKHVQWI